MNTWILMLLKTKDRFQRAVAAHAQCVCSPAAGWRWWRLSSWFDACFVQLILWSFVSVFRSAQGQILFGCLAVRSAVSFSHGSTAAEGQFEGVFHLAAADGIWPGTEGALYEFRSEQTDTLRVWHEWRDSSECEWMSDFILSTNSCSCDALVKYWYSFSRYLPSVFLESNNMGHE